MAVIPTSLYWIMSFVAVGILAVLLRWAYSHGGSLIIRPSRKGKPDEYGLLVVVSSPENFIEGELQRQRLAEAGIKGTLVTTLDGPRLMVFPQNQKKALSVLARNP